MERRLDVVLHIIKEGFLELGNKLGQCVYVIKRCNLNSKRKSTVKYLHVYELFCVQWNAIKQQSIVQICTAPLCKYALHNTSNIALMISISQDVIFHQYRVTGKAYWTVHVQPPLGWWPGVEWVRCNSVNNMARACMALICCPCTCRWLLFSNMA